MTDSVRKPAVARREPNADMIQQIERLLGRAKRGELLAIGFAVEESAGNEAATGYVLTPGYDMAKLVGAVEWLRHRLMQKWTEEDG